MFFWYHVLKSFCYIVISWKRFVNYFFRSSFKEIKYFDNKGNDLEETKLEKYDFKKNKFLIKTYNNKYSQIVRQIQDISKEATKCSFDFCIFYIETPDTEYKLDLNSYFVDGNIFDESFLFFLLKTQHDVKDIEKKKEDIHWMFIDHLMSIHILPSKSKIVLEKNDYKYF